MGSQIFHDSILFSQIEFWLLKPSPILYTLCVHTLCVTQSCLTLWNPMNCSPPGSSVYWIFQARMLEWVAISYSMRSFRPRDWTPISCIDRWLFTTELPGKSLLHYNCNYLSGKQTAIYVHTLISQWIFPNIKSARVRCRECTNLEQGLEGKEDSGQKYRLGRNKTKSVLFITGKWEVIVVLHLIYARYTYIHTYT